MPNRHSGSTADYRYGFNGMEMDIEVNNITGSSYTAEFWQYDSRLGRRWNVDPVVYAWQSSYAAFNNNPIYYADPSGAEGEGPDDEGDAKTGTGVDEQGDFVVYADKPLPAGHGVVQNDNSSFWNDLANFARELDKALSGGYTLTSEEGTNNNQRDGLPSGHLDATYLAYVHTRVRKPIISSRNVDFNRHAKQPRKIPVRNASVRTNNGMEKKLVTASTESVNAGTKSTQIIPNVVARGSKIILSTAESNENIPKKVSNLVHERKIVKTVVLESDTSGTIVKQYVEDVYDDGSTNRYPVLLDITNN